MSNNLSIKDIARMAGVSIATVSRVINKNGKVAKETEKKILKVMEENNYVYCVYGGNKYEECDKMGRGKHYLSSTFEGSKVSPQTRKTCCATFVSWVMQEAGYMTAEEHNTNYCNGAENLAEFLEKNKGFTRVAKSELKPGDIVVCAGHVEIYAGDGQVYAAGSGNAIRRVSPNSNTCLNKCIYGLRAPQ